MRGLRGAVWCSAVAGVLLAACSPGPRAATQNEGLAQFFLAPSPVSGGPLLLVARYEVTRAEFAGDLDPATAELPAVGMSQAEAVAWANERGWRLPTRAEWMHLRTAGGGVSREVGRANTLEMGLGRALPVGAIPSGRTGLGGYDFEGNVWEWLAPEEPADPSSSVVAWQAGGSFANYRVGPREEALRAADSDDRASDVGFRPVTEALRWLHDVELPRWRAADANERASMGRAIDAWGAEIRGQLVRRWEQSYPEEKGFARFLDGEGRDS